MTITRSTPGHAHQRSRGFTVLEIILVLAVVGLLVVVALPQYQSYVARSQAAELLLKYDAIRTGMQVVAKSGELQSACAGVVNTVQAANLQSPHARLAVRFESVAGGYTPVLAVCASSAVQGAQGVAVTREAHNLLSRNSTIGQGAVVGDSVVSFSVRLAGDTALCRVLPPVGSERAACGPSGGQATLPASGASVPVPQTSVPVPQASTPQGSVASCTAGPVSRKVMRFSGHGHVASTNLDTGGDMTGFSAEAVITGDTQNGPEATLISYATSSAFTGFALWGPSSLRIEIGPIYYNTGVNVEDGKTHRLTMSWQQAGGVLVLYDNGREVWRRTAVNAGGVVRGGGKLTIGEADVSAQWGAGTFKNGYTGSIVNAAVSNRVVSAAQVASGPLHKVFQAGSGLLTDVVVGANGQPVDTTGRGIYTATGGVSMQSAVVDTSVYTDASCR